MNAGEVRAIAKVDRIDGPSSWTVSGDCHMLILYEAGSYHWLETWLDGRRTSLGDPIPGEMWLAPFGHEYRATAQGGAVRSIEVEIPHHRLAVSPHARAIAGHDDPAMAALARALAAGCLSKPYGPRDLTAAIDAIEAVLDGQQPKKLSPPFSLFLERAV